MGRLLLPSLTISFLCRHLMNLTHHRRKYLSTISNENSLGQSLERTKRYVYAALFGWLRQLISSLSIYLWSLYLCMFVPMYAGMHVNFIYIYIYIYINHLVPIHSLTQSNPNLSHLFHMQRIGFAVLIWRKISLLNARERGCKRNIKWSNYVIYLVTSFMFTYTECINIYMDGWMVECMNV